MQSRIVAFLLFALSFGMLAVASPVASTELAKRGGSDQLQAILNLCLDLQVKIAAIIKVMAALDVKADISVYVAQIVVLVNVFVSACASIGAIVDLSDTDKIMAIAKVCASIILDIQACISVFAAIVVNVVACASLDVALKALCIQLNVCISGFLVIFAPLCVHLTAYVNLSLTLVLQVLALV